MLFELRPGATYIIEHPNALSEKIKDRILEGLYNKTQRLGCDFIILDGGLTIVREVDDGDKEERLREVERGEYTTCVGSFDPCREW